LADPSDDKCQKIGPLILCSVGFLMKVSPEKILIISNPMNFFALMFIMITNFSFVVKYPSPLEHHFQQHIKIIIYQTKCLSKLFYFQ